MFYKIRQLRNDEQMIQRRLSWDLLTLSAFGLLGWIGASAQALASEVNLPLEVQSHSHQLVAACSALGCEGNLKAWDLSDLTRLGRKSSRERDPVTGKMVKWNGVLLSTVLEKALNELTLERRAQIDLIILKGKSGERALIPRALVSKYPVLLALSSDSRKVLDDRGPIYSVVPWSSKPRILSEDLPLEKYFVPQLDRIELTNYRQVYRPLYLKRRTDPSAMRGEKIFVQNCTGCHSEQPLSAPISLMGAMAKQGVDDQAERKIYHHPSVQGAPQLSDRDTRSIWRYLKEFRQENQTGGASSAGTSVQAETVPSAGKSFL